MEVAQKPKSTNSIKEGRALIVKTVEGNMHIGLIALASTW